MMTKNILFITDYLFELGGAERNLYEIVLRINKQKYHPIVFSLQGGKIIEELNKRGIEASNLNIKRIYDFKALKEGIKLIDFIKRKKVSIVITYHEGADIWGGIIAKLSGVQVIISSRRDLGYNLNNKHLFTYRLINNLVFSKIVTPCKAIKKVLIETQAVTADKIVTIYNGVEKEKFVPTGGEKKNLRDEFGIQRDDLVVGLIADIRKIKGCRYFIKAASIILKKIPNVKFLIMGKIEDPIDDTGMDIFILIKELQLTNNVILTGRRSDIPEILSLMDISVLSSLSEGFSNTILESMAAGKAVIATNVGGNPEAVVDGVTGILVNSRDSNKLADAVMLLLNQKELMLKMGAAGRKRIQEFFCIERMIEDFDSLFEYLLASGDKEKITDQINLKVNKILKVLVSDFLFYSGLINLWVKFRRKKEIKILAYHRICDNYPYLNLATKVSDFRKQIRYLKKNYKIILLKEAVELLRFNKPIPYSSVVITFDDGDKSIFDNALPVLREFNIPATVFLSINPIEFDKPLWFDIVTHVVISTQREVLDLTNIGLKMYLLNTDKRRVKAIDDISAYVKKLNINRREIFLLNLAKLLLVNVDKKKFCRENSLSWAEVIKMKEAGISFGAHTLSHPILSNISLEETKQEILESKRILEGKLNESVHTFAYPNGGRSDFNEDIINLLKENDFLCACTLINGGLQNKLFSLRRLNIHEMKTANTFKSFELPLFAFEVAGIFAV